MTLGALSWRQATALLSVLLALLAFAMSGPQTVAEKTHPHLIS